MANMLQTTVLNAFSQKENLSIFKKWVPLGQSENGITLVQVMAWCHRHHLQLQWNIQEQNNFSNLVMKNYTGLVVNCGISNTIVLEIP